MEQQPVCLTIGGSDSCGGAGIQADLRVFEALRLKGCSAITALTAQNPKEVRHIQGSSPSQFEAEIRAIHDYYDVAAIKTGMLLDDEHLNLVVSLKQTLFPDAQLIVDPVLISSSGKKLFQAADAQASYKQLIELATIWTPNLQEAAFFLNQEIDDPVDAASSLLLAFKTPLLLKGGHGSSEQLCDIFSDEQGNVEFFSHRKLTLSDEDAHGTGCRLASAIAAHLAMKQNLTDAVSNAYQWLQGRLKGT